ncbi:FtsX-like permease family protein, partial [Pseudomonas sp.]|uniref:FtsX-like permease family protein n=1 Tax=Pseudomonas sp. TaxID=306 RepID=UPI002E332DAE
TVVSNLFSGQDPVGQTIQVGGSQYQIIGVTASKGSNGIQDQDDVVFAPITAVEDTLTGYGGLNSLTVQATSATTLNAAQAEVTQILDTTLHVTDPTNPGFQVINQGSVLQASNATTDVFTTLLGAVAAISLLVGGIGVMNIMLVSVTERTREIGIRMAVGARQSDIRQQFLVEAVMVCLLGGAIGISLSYAIGHLFSVFIKEWEMVFSMASVVTAVICSTLIGIVFGFVPARNASRLDPIEALARD